MKNRNKKNSSEFFISKPMVSVFLPAYNNEKHLSKSLQSILNQTYNNIEVVICDDGSTDNTYQIAKNYKKKYPNKIILEKNKSNLGIVKNCNKIYTMCSGKYCVFTSGDDIFYPTKIEEMTAILEKNKSLVLLGHHLPVIDENDKRIGILKAMRKRGKGNSAWIKFGLHYAAASIMIRKNNEIKFDDSVPLLNDFKFFIDIIGDNGFYDFIPKELGEYRKTKNSVTLQKGKCLVHQRRLFKYLKKSFPNKRKECDIGYINNYLYPLARYLSETKKVDLAVRVFLIILMNKQKIFRSILRILQIQTLKLFKK